MARHTTIQDLPEDERPYEKFLAKGAESLSDAELLSIILRCGTKDMTSTELARLILSGKQGNLLNLYEFSFEELLKMPGIGKVKAVQLKSVAELSRRIAATRRGYHIRLKDPASIAEYYMEQLRHLPYEQFLVAFFDAKCTFLGDAVIARGSVASAAVPPRNVFRSALICNAVMLVLVHNHPSGDPSPSGEDISLTHRLGDIGSSMEINVVDHIIIGDNYYYSFKENLLIS